MSDEALDGEIVQDVGQHRPARRHSIPLNVPPLRSGETIVVQSTIQMTPDGDVFFIGDAQVEIILEGEIMPERPAIAPPAPPLLQELQEQGQPPLPPSPAWEPAPR